jgi:MFS transporter, DHA1 family, multidrug resistance protein
MFFFLPETSAENVLLRRAQRLRKVTGNSKIRSQSEINRKGTKFGKVVLDALVKPLEIMVKDPAVLFTNVYTSLIYGIYYSFFEVFPLVYPPIYGFSLGLTGTTFICIIVACLLGVSIYVGYLLIYLIPDILKNGLRAQEHRLVPALFAIFFPTIGLFIFGKLHFDLSLLSIRHYHWIFYRFETER